MRRVVSVSLGSATRNWKADLSAQGVPLSIERLGVGLDYRRYTETLAALDSDDTVAAIGLGGINRYLFSAERKYPLRRAEEMARIVTHKPVCDGSALKQHWEPYLVRAAVEAGALNLKGRRALMVCAVDRWGMAESLWHEGAEVVLGDLMFGLGVPLPLRSMQGVRRLTRLLLPVLTRHVPFEWLYPTGESRKAARFGRWYAWAEMLAGDWKFMYKHLPAGTGSLAGKVVLTNTTTPEDVEVLRARGAELLMTTTPNLDGRSFGTNAVEAAAAAISGLGPEQLGLQELLAVFRPLGWDQPRIQRLQSPR